MGTEQTPSQPIRPTITLSDIERTIQDYIKCARRNPRITFTGGANRVDNIVSRVIGDCERAHLIIYKYHGMHTLQYEAFRKIPILLLDTEQYQVTHDYYYYWAFATDVYDHLQSNIIHIYDHEIQRRLHLMMDLLFMLPQEPEPASSTRKLSKALGILSPRLKNIDSNMEMIIPHLVYPLIEALGRRMLSSTIARDGTALTSIQQFTAQDGEEIGPINQKSRINSIATLLRILEYSTSDLQLQSDLEEFRGHFDTVYSQLANKQKAYDLISGFRNRLLHGEKLWQILYAALTNLACMLITSAISKAMYDDNYDSLISKLTRNQNMQSSDVDQSYYPP
jgi:hypothetical protein